LAGTKRGGGVAERVGNRFVLIFLASFFLSRKRMKWGSGQSPGCLCQYDTYDFKRMIITRCRHSKTLLIKTDTHNIY
jgi:hypothetical protein